MHEVRDTGQTVKAGTCCSVTNYESACRTDNSFGNELPDDVGLLCRNSANWRESYASFI